jgi:YHS domain-containing protein
MVEDPVAKVVFPKFAAAASLEHEGKTLYFIDEATLQEFEKTTSARESSTEFIDAHK